MKNDGMILIAERSEAAVMMNDQFIFISLIVLFQLIVVVVVIIPRSIK